MKGCLLIHGFTGSPYELQPLAEHLREHTNWNLYTPTLAGHGERNALRSTTWMDWVDSAERVLKKATDECEELYVIGFSMGSLIAGYLASKYPIAKLILLSPAIFTPHTPMLIKELSEVVRDFFHEKENAYESLERYKRKWTTTPIRAIVNFRRLVRNIKPILKDIQVPVLIIHGERDHVANPKGAQYIYECVQSDEKEIVMLKESKHIVCHDCEKDVIFQKVAQFLSAEEKVKSGNPQHTH